MSFEDKAKAYANNLDIDKFPDYPSLDEAPWMVVAAYGVWLKEELGADPRGGCEPFLGQFWPGFLDEQYTEAANKEARALVTDYWATLRQDALLETM